MALRNVIETQDFVALTVRPAAGDVMSFTERAAPIIVCCSFTNFSILLLIITRTSLGGEHIANAASPT